MKDLTLNIVSNRPLNPNIYNLVLEVEDLEKAIPGQFVQISLDGFFLRRPISICDINDNRIRLVFKPFSTSFLARKYMGGSPTPPPTSIAFSTGRSILNP